MPDVHSPTPITKTRHRPQTQARRHRATSLAKRQETTSAFASSALTAAIQQLLTLLGERADAGLALVDASDRVTYLNATAASMLHVSAAGLEGETIGALWQAVSLLANDAAAAETQLAALYSRGELESITIALIAPPAAAPLTITLCPLRDNAAIIACRVILLTASTTGTTDTVGTLALIAACFEQMRTPLSHIQETAASLAAPARRWDLTALYQVSHSITSDARYVQDALQTLSELQELRASPAPLRLSPVELGDLMMTIIPRWQSLAPHHLFELALPGELPAVSADKQRVETALDILLEYAVALAPAGGTVRVDIRPHAEDVAISIRHQGYRILPEHLEHICEPFHRLPDLPEVSVRGGLGLTLAETILSLHGGCLRAETLAAEMGSALIATWPVVPVSLTRIEQVTPIEPPAPAPRLTPPRERRVVLVVDSDPRMLRYLRANLDAQRYRSVIASDLEEAQRQAELEEPELILLDTHAGGAEALERLQHAACAPIIVLTRRHDPDECARLLDLGAVDYVVKPFSMDEMLARIRVALRVHESQQRAALREPIFQSGDLTIDFAQRSVMVAGKPVALSKTEFKLLRALAQHAGMVLSHEMLLENVWGAAYLDEIEFIWVYIRRLRRKLEPDPSHPRYILTVPGVGYRLART